MFKDATHCPMEEWKETEERCILSGKVNQATWSESENRKSQVIDEALIGVVAATGGCIGSKVLISEMKGNIMPTV